ncbi:MAG: cytochrome c [Alphaproteobacteria bacterium]|nr:cytochrome c [Alphaproteobacteria bacterium]
MRTKMMAMVFLVLTSGAAQALSSIWDGPYTDAQADRGRTTYMQNCSRCHGATLMGTFEIPPLVGRIMPYYAGSSLETFIDYISTAMPLDRPGSLSPATIADIVAYILKTNDVPSGSKELTAAGSKAIQFDAKPRKK